MSAKNSKETKNKALAGAGAETKPPQGDSVPDTSVQKESEVLAGAGTEVLAGAGTDAEMPHPPSALICANGEEVIKT